MDYNHNYADLKNRIYLPSLDEGASIHEYLNRYINREFPTSGNGITTIYSVPCEFKQNGKRQASLAEEKVFNCLKNIGKNEKNTLWLTFFHSAFYAGHSFRNHRDGKLMIREHDFVVFAKYQGKNFVALIEVKSTTDSNTTVSNLEKVSDAKVIKNNKRSAQHQLRDHMEVLEGILCDENVKHQVQNYIMWPFLGELTKDPKQQIVQRWKEDDGLHVFEQTISDQKKFDEWVFNTLLTAKSIEDEYFTILLNRFIMLSCGVFVDEIDKGMVALLTQEQLQLLNSDICRQSHGKALVVHGAAGTGKTLLVLKKLEQLYQTGRLNENNRALVIFYWPGIRCEVEMKLETLGIREYVDTVRYFISLNDFLKFSNNTYKHILMDESEALCLSFEKTIVHRTLSTIYQRYHDGNCFDQNCAHSTLELFEDLGEKLAKHPVDSSWGELWLMVDINQASMFLPKHSPQVLKKPSIILTKVMRSTRSIFNVFKQFYSTPMPALPKAIVSNMVIPNITVGHHIMGPPVFWVEASNDIDKMIANVIIDLCGSKGFKPKDLCVLPFLVNEKLIPESVNRHITDAFVENGFRPNGIKDVEQYLKIKSLNDFLMPWVLRVKGLEFKVVVMAIDDDDFDYKDSEDRKKAYIMASRCTCLLVIISNREIKEDMDVDRNFVNYPFGENFRACTIKDNEKEAII